MVSDFQTLGYFVVTRYNSLPDVMAFKLARGELIAVAGEFQEVCVNGDCLDSICRDFQKGFNQVLIVTPNQRVKEDILRHIRQHIPEQLRYNIAVVVMRQQGSKLN